MSRLDRLMAEPHRDDCRVDTSLQEIHCRGVPEHVWRDVFAAKRRAGLARHGDVLGKQVLDTVTTQSSTASCGEDDETVTSCRLQEPSLKNRNRLLRQRRAALLAPLAHHADMRAGTKKYVVTPEPSELRQAQPRLNGKEDPCIVASTGPRSSVRGCE